MVCNPLSFLIYIYPPITGSSGCEACPCVPRPQYRPLPQRLPHANLPQDIYSSNWEVFLVHTSMPWELMGLSIQATRHPLNRTVKEF